MAKVIVTRIRVDLPVMRIWGTEKVKAVRLEAVSLMMPSQNCTITMQPLRIK